MAKIRQHGRVTSICAPRPQYNLEWLEAYIQAPISASEHCQEKTVLGRVLIKRINDGESDRSTTRKALVGIISRAHTSQLGNGMLVCTYFVQKV